MSNTRYQMCNHIKPNRMLCGSPAMKGKAYCYFHYRVGLAPRKPAATPEQFAATLPPIDTPQHIQTALDQTIRAVAAGKITPQLASIILRGLKFASTNLHGSDGFNPPDPDESDDEFSDDESAESEIVDEPTAARTHQTSAAKLPIDPVTP